MNSQELTHLHALLYEVRVELEGQEKVPTGAFTGYDSQDTRPDYIHRDQEAHREGIDLLLNGIRYSIRKDPLSEREVTM